MQTDLIGMSGQNRRWTEQETAERTERRIAQIRRILVGMALRAVPLSGLAVAAHSVEAPPSCSA